MALFPELGLSAYSDDDLFHQDALLEATREALGQLVEASRDLSPVLLVGAPLRVEAKLFNCAVVVYDITQAVRPPCGIYREHPLTSTGIPR